MSGHVEDLELYALGVLEPDERAAIDAHLATCAECSQRVGEAERIVAALEPGMFDAPAQTAAPVVVPLRRRWFADPAASFAWLASAAAIVVAVGFGGIAANEHARMATMISSDDLIADTLVHSHFLHAAFVPVADDAPGAKVLYARDGSWLYVVVDGNRPGLRVACTRAAPSTASGSIDLGEAQPRGSTSELFAHPPQRPGALQLLDTSGKQLASVILTYPASH